MGDSLCAPPQSNDPEPRSPFGDGAAEDGTASASLLRVVIVPCLSDNYAYLLVEEASKTALAVDPAEAGVVYARAEQEGVRLVGILTTHHHWDHAGGNNEMARKVNGLTIYGGREDNVEGCTAPLDHGQEIQLGAIKIQALSTPGHTRGSVCYYCTVGDDNLEGVVFTGDTLFVGGCGRPMECPPDVLHHSLSTVLASLPAATRVYVGHEYTVKNLTFAVGVEAENEHLQQMLKWAQEQQMARKYTVPSTMSNEWMINPFMRASTELKSICPGCTPVAIFTELRRQKNDNRPDRPRLEGLISGRL